MAAENHVLVYWNEEDLMSVVKAAQVVELTNPETGSNAKVKWGRQILPAMILGIGSKASMKRKPSDRLKNEKSVDDCGPVKKRRCTREGKIAKGKKQMEILVVTEPSSEPIPIQEGNDSTVEDSLVSEEIPTQAPDMVEELLSTNSEDAFTPAEVPLSPTLPKKETWMNSQFSLLRAAIDLQAARINELQDQVVTLSSIVRNFVQSRIG